MVMIRPLSYSLASYRRSMRWAEPRSQPQRPVCRVVAPRKRSPVFHGKHQPVLPNYIRTTEADEMRLFSILSGRRLADNSGAIWIKSSLSAYNGNCVEVTGLDNDRIRVRDSKHPKGAVLNFTPAEWDAFVGGVHKGEFDRPTGTR